MQAYGSALFQGSAVVARRMFSADGATLFLSDDMWNCGHHGLQAMDVETGVTVTGETVHGYVPCGDHVVGVRAGDPTTLGVYQVRDLKPVHVVPIGVSLDVPAAERARCLAAGGGTVAARCLDPHAVVMLDVATGEARRVDLPEKPSCVAVSEDGAIVVVGSDQRRSAPLFVVDVATGTVVHTLVGARAPVSGVLVRGNRVVASVNARVLTWTLPAPGAVGKPSKASFIAAGKKPAELLGITSGGVVVARLDADQWGGDVAGLDPATGRQVWSIPHAKGMMCGDRLAVNRGYRDDFVEVDAHTGHHLRVAERTPRVEIDALSADLVAVAHQTGVEFVRDPAAPPPPVSAHRRVVNAVAFGGDRFVTTCDRRGFVWTRGQTDPAARLEPDWSHTSHTGIHLDGDDVYTTFRIGVQHWRADGTLLATSPHLAGQVTLVRPLPDGLVLAATSAFVGNAVVTLLDGTTLEPVHTAPLDFTVADAGWLDDSRIELRGELGNVVYDTLTRECVDRHRHPGAATHNSDIPRFHPVPALGLMVEMRDGDGGNSLRVTDLADGTVRHEITQAEDFEWHAAAVSAEGTFATAHHGRLTIYELSSGTRARELPAPPSIKSLWWFPDGTALLAATLNGGLHEFPV